MNAFWNRIINALSLMAFAFMVSTGSILEWILPPGSGRMGAAGNGHHRREVHTLMGLDRHAWGEIHFYVSIGLIVLLSVHLFLHRKWILATAWGTVANPQPVTRKIITAGIIAFILAVLALPWIIRSLN